MTLCFQVLANLGHWTPQRHILALYWRSEDGKDCKNICNPSRREHMPKLSSHPCVRAWMITKTDDANLNRSGMYKWPARFCGGATVGLRLEASPILVAVVVMVDSRVELNTKHRLRKRRAPGSCDRITMAPACKYEDGRCIGTICTVSLGRITLCSPYFMMLWCEAACILRPMGVDELE